MCLTVVGKETSPTQLQQTRLFRTLNPNCIFLIPPSPVVPSAPQLPVKTQISLIILQHTLGPNQNVSNPKPKLHLLDPSLSCSAECPATALQDPAVPADPAPRAALLKRLSALGKLAGLAAGKDPSAERDWDASTACSGSEGDSSGWGASRAAQKEGEGGRGQGWLEVVAQDVLRENAQMRGVHSARSVLNLLLVRGQQEGAAEGTACGAPAAVRL